MMDLMDIPKVQCVQMAPLKVSVNGQLSTLKFCKRFRFRYRDGTEFQMEIRKNNIVLKQSRGKKHARENHKSSWW